MNKILFQKRSEKNIYLTAVVGICAVFFLFTALVQSLRSMVPDHGNYWTDMSVMLQAENFKKCGILPLKFVATWDQGCQIGLALPKNTSFTSIHPSLAAIVVAFLEQIGLTLPFIRLIMLFFSTVAILGVFLFTFDWFRNGKLALFVSFSLSTLPFFRLLSDNLTVPYDIGVRVWMYYLISRYAQSSSIHEKRKWLLLCFVGAFLNGLFFSVEIIPSIVVFSALAPLTLSLAQGKFSIKNSVLLLSFIGLGYTFSGVIRLIQLYWALGSIDLVEQLVLGRARHRLSSPELSSVLPGLDYSLWLAYRILRLAPLQVPFLFIGALLPWIAFKKSQENGTGLSLNSRFFYSRTMPILLSEIIWYILFKQHSFEHDHTILQVTISLALLSGAAVFYIGEIIEGKTLSKWVQLIALFLLTFQMVSLQGVKSLGYNVQTFFDTSFLDKQLSVLAPLFDEVEIINLAEPPAFPPFYLNERIKRLPNRPIITWRAAEELVGNQHLLLVNPYGPGFNDLINRVGLVGLTRHYAVFDPQTSLTFLNLFYGKFREVLSVEETWEQDIGLLGFWLGKQPKSLCFGKQDLSDFEDKAVIWLVLIPSELQEQRSLKTQLDIKVEDCETQKIDALFSLDNSNGWNSLGIYPMSIPQKDHFAGVIISLECSGSPACDNTQVFMAPVMIARNWRNH